MCFKLLIICCFLFCVTTSFAKQRINRPKEGSFNNPILSSLDTQYLKSTNKKELLKLKKSTLSLGGKAVPVLIKVMKSGKYPEKSRWVATFLLGRIMGKKAGPFLVKFLKHPSWVMRMASLKTLSVLKMRKYGIYYAHLLKDKSMLVRVQAMESIRMLGLKEYGDHVWAMLYDKKNYHNVQNKRKRTNIIKRVIKIVGDLNLQKAKKPLFKMINDKKYKDIFKEMDYSLSKLTKKKSPKGDYAVKRLFWNRMSLKEFKL